MKTKELLAGLAGQGIELNTRALARFTAENGVLVNVRCGRRRGRISLPPKLVGLRPEKWKDNCKSFFDGHISLGQLTLVPKELDSHLNQLDTKVRRLQLSYTINGSYMPLAFYQEFKEEFESIRKEYLATIDQVASEWDTIREEFIRDVKGFVEARGRGVLKRDREKMIQNIIGSIPTASAYRDSAYMELEVRAFPTTGVTTEGLALDIQDSINSTWRDDVISNAVKSIEACIGQVFSQVCKAAEVYARTGKMDGRNLSALARTATRILRMNVFSNPMQEQLGKRLSDISELDSDTAESVVEDAILDTVLYARSTGIKLDMKCCPFTEQQIQDMLDVRTKYAV